MDPFRNYDAWLEEPYQRAAAQAEAAICPECDDETLEYEEDGVYCTNPECDYSNYIDWDSQPGGADYVD